MKASFLGAGLLVTLVAAAPTASAQQHVQQQHTQANPQVARLAHYPMPAATYHVHVDQLLGILRKAKPIGPITKADYDKAILMLKDCSSRAEADGVVTKAESKYCHAQLTQFKRDKLREIMANSTPQDWARWKAALPTGGDND